MCQHIQEYIDEQISRLMDNLYYKLNKKLDALTNQTSTQHNNNENASKFQSRPINRTNMKFTREQIQTLSLGPNYAIEQENECICWLIIKVILRNARCNNKDKNVVNLDDKSP